jgi:hypothetical protein
MEKDNFFFGKNEKTKFAPDWPKGHFEKTKCAIYVTSTPLVFLSKKPAKLGTHKVEDCWAQWLLNAPDDLTCILDMLKNYRKRTQKDFFIVAENLIFVALQRFSSMSA